ncbi:MAG: alpha/beta hydrolase family protein, partial [Steroidobacteraceae bacterium]
MTVAPRRKILLSVAALIVVGALGAYLYTRPEPADTRFTGAYTLDDGSLALIAPREGKVLRYKLVNGESGALWPTENGWQRADTNTNARKLALPERVATFPSGDIALRGKLVLPSGQGPFPAVVFVHGSESSSAVDHYADPYLQAANGLAGLAFDRRGTGESEGDYLQNFH